MKKRCLFWGVLLIFGSYTYGQDLGETYISEWKKFYPSKAERSGMHDAIFSYENLAAPNVEQWLAFNKETLHRLSQDDTKVDRLDARLLRVQAQSEIDRYETLEKHRNSLQLYSHLISNAMPHVSKADYLLAPEKSSLFCERLEAITQLALAAKTNLSDVPKVDLERGLKEVSATLAFLGKDWIESRQGIAPARCAKRKEIALQTLQELKTFAEELLQNAKSSEPVLGPAEYNRQLQLYTDSDITSQQLEAMALAEIDTVKSMMTTVAKAYLKITYPNTPLPDTELDILKKALADMEKDAPLNSADYLQFWQQLATAAVDFIEENAIVTLPKTNTLQIRTAPESAGPAARIGWVASAPPFAPNPITILYLPSIPETLPKQEQIDFWASFNKPFNRMIVIHELYPGHYTQLKISRTTPHPVRLLFPYGIYIEGWATLTERVLLDAGWEKGNHLTFLAHLRKRLENANRSYTSVQVHCNGWNQEQVLQFSTETALLAPQFAKSLWGRIMNSPMQLTSYFLGATAFSELLRYEKERLGEKFNLKFFMDTVMKAGAIPIDEFYTIFKQMQPTG
ncbi:MAG: DUF885 family protein [Bacteroidota bacterium]